MAVCCDPSPAGQLSEQSGEDARVPRARQLRASSPSGPRWHRPLQPAVLRPQIGLFDLEVNCLTKILFGALVVVSLVMVALQHFAGRWYLQIIRFLLLFSNIIPIR